MSLRLEYIQPICLPAYGQRLIDGQMGTVTGWGNVGYYGESTFQYPTICVNALQDCSFAFCF